MDYPNGLLNGDGETKQKTNDDATYQIGPSGATYQEGKVSCLYIRAKIITAHFKDEGAAAYVDDEGAAAYPNDSFATSFKMVESVEPGIENNAGAAPFKKNKSADVYPYDDVLTLFREFKLRGSGILLNSGAVTKVVEKANTLEESKYENAYISGSFSYTYKNNKVAAPFDFGTAAAAHQKDKVSSLHIKEKDASEYMKDNELIADPGAAAYRKSNRMVAISKEVNDSGGDTLNRIGAARLVHTGEATYIANEGAAAYPKSYEMGAARKMRFKNHDVDILGGVHSANSGAEYTADEGAAAYRKNNGMVAISKEVNDTGGDILSGMGAARLVNPDEATYIANGGTAAYPKSDRVDAIFKKVKDREGGILNSVGAATVIDAGGATYIANETAATYPKSNGMGAMHKKVEQGDIDVRGNVGTATIAEAGGTTSAEKKAATGSVKFDDFDAYNKYKNKAQYYSKVFADLFKQINSSACKLHYNIVTDVDKDTACFQATKECQAVTKGLENKNGTVRINSDVGASDNKLNEAFNKLKVSNSKDAFESDQSDHSANSDDTLVPESPDDEESYDIKKIVAAALLNRARKIEVNMRSIKNFFIEAFDMEQFYNFLNKINVEITGFHQSLAESAHLISAAQRIELHNKLLELYNRYDALDQICNATKVDISKKLLEANTKIVAPTKYLNRNRRDSIHIAMRGNEVNNKIIQIEYLKNSLVEIHGHAEKITIENVVDCLVYCGPAKNMVYIDNCYDTVFIVASKQIRLRNSDYCLIYKIATEDTILENCSFIKFGPYDYDYETIEDDFEKTGVDRFDNCRNEILDLTWHNSKEPSPNWKYIESLDGPEWKKLKQELLSKILEMPAEAPKPM